MEGRRTRGRAAAEKSGRGARAAGLEPSEPEADDGSPTEPWRRPVTDSVLRRIMTIRPKVLRQQFGWRPHRGPPRMALHVGGQRLELGGQEVMAFNKEGRDGFPWKTHWVGLLVDRLGARLGDTLLLQKQHTDGEGVIHAEASLERGPQGESSGSDGGAQIAATARAAVAVAVALAPRPSASSFGSAWDSGNEVEQQSEEGGEEEEEEGEEAAGVEQQEGEEVDAAAGQQTPPAKRRRSGRHGAEDSAAVEVATASEGLACRNCGRSYIYPGACARHEERCEQQHAGKDPPEQPEPGGMDCSGPNMGALLAAVEQVDAEPALLAAAPAAAATEDSIAAAAAGAAQPTVVGSSPALAAHAAQAAQRRVEQALRAFEEAGDTASPEGMLHPLRLLALIGHGGALLQDLLGRWGSLGLDRQQQVFDSALVAAGQGAWAQLEGRLRAALGPSDANAN